MVKLSILICTIEERKTRFNVLMARIENLLHNSQLLDQVEVISECDNREMSIGAKRNILLLKASGDYLCFIDDDDTIDEEYFIKILKALDSNPDCVQMIGVMNTDGWKMERFEHSIAHNRYYEQGGIYYRYPNHLNPIRREIAIQFKFPESNFGEDTDWATQIKDSALLQREEPIDKVIYHYRFSSRK